MTVINEIITASTHFYMLGSEMSFDESKIKVRGTEAICSFKQCVMKHNASRNQPKRVECFVRFQIITAVVMKHSIFWDRTP
jgi:hypothetical protein